MFQRAERSAVAGVAGQFAEERQLAAPRQGSRVPARFLPAEGTVGQAPVLEHPGPVGLHPLPQARPAAQQRLVRDLDRRGVDGQQPLRHEGRERLVHVGRHRALGVGQFRPPDTAAGVGRVPAEMDQTQEEPACGFLP